MRENEELMLDVGQANELKLAFRRAGYLNEDIKYLCEGNILADVLNVRLGRAEIKLFDPNTEHIIDCDAAPMGLNSLWSVEEHQKGGQWVWDASKVRLWAARGQGDPQGMRGEDLRKELIGKPVLNANVLDYLLAHPYIVPDDWDCVTFWGTIYRFNNRRLFVRNLRRRDKIRFRDEMNEIRGTNFSQLAPAGLHVK